MIEIHASSARGSTLTEHDNSLTVRTRNQHDEIIDRALEIQTLSGRSIMFVTYDTGQSTRGRVAGLNVVKCAAPLTADEPRAG